MKYRKNNAVQPTEDKHMAEANKLSKDERKALTKGIDALIASTSRSAAKEENAQIKKLREQEIQDLVILKNKLITQELTL